jgi:23S rRNA pseudouridine1911/1915/1917 synthase
MPIRRLYFVVNSEDTGKRLDQFLSEHLPGQLGIPLSKAKVRKLILAGAVYLNKHRVRIASKSLLTNAKVEAYVDISKLQDDAPSLDLKFAMSERDILFEDDFLIAINKPSGLPTQPTVDEARINLYAAVKNYLAKRDNIRQPYLGLHQRLDKETSGVILFTKRREANAKIADSFTNHQIRKVYQAITRQPSNSSIPNMWSVENYLGRIPSDKGKISKYGAVKRDGSFAHTDFRLIEDLDIALWIEAYPKTGRTHQIRVHLSEYGIPILGDTLYARKDTALRGAKDVSKGLANRLMLHASSLTFIHPIDGRELTITSPLPHDFKECLQRLRTKV